MLVRWPLSLWLGGMGRILLKNIILYKFRIAAALIAIALVVQQLSSVSAPAANCQSHDAQTTVANILKAKGHDVINKKYSELFAALKEHQAPAAERGVAGHCRPFDRRHYARD